MERMPAECSLLLSVSPYHAADHTRRCLSNESTTENEDPTEWSLNPGRVMQVTPRVPVRGAWTRDDKREPSINHLHDKTHATFEHTSLRDNHDIWRHVRS
jgi:hypothetical protein